MSDSSPAPTEGGQLDFRFVERPGGRHNIVDEPVRVLQWRKSIVAPKQPPEFKVTGRPALIWGEWKDVRTEKEGG
jgi:hypothetical protein